MWNPCYEQSLFAVDVHLHTVGILQASHHSESPVVVAQGVVNLRLFLGSHRRSHIVEHLFLAFVEDFDHLAALDVSQHMGLWRIADNEVIGVGEGSLSIAVHHRCHRRLRIESAVGVQFFFVNLEGVGNMERNLADQVVECSLVGRGIGVTPSFSADVARIVFQFFRLLLCLQFCFLCRLFLAGTLCAAGDREAGNQCEGKEHFQ